MSLLRDHMTEDMQIRLLWQTADMAITSM